MNPSDLFPLSDLPKYIPPVRSDRPRNKSTVYRYVKRGLEVVQDPSRMFTSLDRWERFVARLTAQGAVALTTTTRAASKKNGAVEAKIEAVRATLRRKGGR